MSKRALAWAVVIALSGVTAAAAGSPEAERSGKEAFGSFSGEILPVLYVKDVLKSVAFYTEKLGFALDHFHDAETGESVPEWTKEAPPIYAEMRAGDQKFALHRASDPEGLRVGGTRLYFGMTNVEEHHRIVKERGVAAGEPSRMPWMTMFSVTDPDGHEIFFFTRPEDRVPGD